MRISFNWLKDFIDITQTPQEIAALLTDCGLEVEGIEDWESISAASPGHNRRTMRDPNSPSRGQPDEP